MESIWIRSGVGADGVYRVLLALGPDEVMPLDPPRARAWVEYVVSVLTAADHDAAVLMQMRALALPPRVAAAMIARVRAERVASMPTSPVPTLVLEPAVMPAQGTQVKEGVIPQQLLGWVRLVYRGEKIGFWTSAAAMDHALGVLICLANTVLDTAYLHALQNDVGLDREPATAVITELNSRRGLPRVAGSE